MFGTCGIDYARGRARSAKGGCLTLVVADSTSSSAFLKVFLKVGESFLIEMLAL